jgi:small GTP-binding protein
VAFSRERGTVRNMDGLREYQRCRLDLADAMRAALYVARGRGDAHTEQRFRHLLARLAEDRFRLAVVGRFSRGKSTLMNALLGAPYLPTGTQPMTSVVTTVTYGSRPRTWFRRRGSDTPNEAPLSELARYVARSSTERAELQITDAEVQVPAELLRLGVAFIDTPGVGTDVRASTAVTRRFLPEADAVIYVTGFDEAFTDTEAAFLAEAAQRAGRLFLVVNKRDLVTDEQAERVLESMRRRMEDDPHLDGTRLFAISALRAQQARADGDADRLAHSGLPAFETALVEFLTREKAGLFLRTAAERATRIVAALRRDLTLGRLDTDGGPASEQVAVRFETRLDDIHARQRTLNETILRRIDAVVPESLSAGAEARRADLRAALEPCVDEAVAGAQADTADRGYALSARDRLEDAGRPLVDAWLSRHAARAHEAVLDAVGDEIGALLELARCPGIAGAEIAGLALPDDRAEPTGWSPDEVPAPAVPRITWSVPPSPPRWAVARPLARTDREHRRLSRALDEAIRATDHHAARALAAMARNWAERLGEQAEQETREAADRFRRNLSTSPDDEELAALATLSDRLTSMIAALDSWTPRTLGPAESERKPDVAGRAHRCMVCDQLEAEAFDWLRHAQLRLATRENDQAAHARDGGFCPPHTWQFAAMASPVGISAAYAELAEHTADLLDPDGERPTGAVAGPDRHREPCPICAVLAERQREAVADVVAQSSGGHVPVLCLHHVDMALATQPAPSPDVARGLPAALAAALRRDAQDMRAFALKREALRADLVTAEESHAYDEVLRLLAGHRALAAPPTGEEHA